MLPTCCAAKETRHKAFVEKGSSSGADFVGGDGGCCCLQGLHMEIRIDTHVAGRCFAAIQHELDLKIL